MLIEIKPLLSPDFSILSVEDKQILVIQVDYTPAPFIGAAIAILFFHETTSLLFGIAAALMGMGIWLHLTEHHDHEHTHEPLGHEHSHIHDEHYQHAHDFLWDGKEPHRHYHKHKTMKHSHTHFPDIHHRHKHK